MTRMMVDPTRTIDLRRRFMAAIRARFMRIRKEVVHLVVTEDAFGLKRRRFSDKTRLRFTFNDRFAFLTDASKVLDFRKWLEERVEAGVLAPVGGVPGKTWTAEFLESSYKRGQINAYTQVHSAALAKSVDFYQGSKQQFLQDAFNAPETRAKLQALYVRDFTQLKGITDAMSQQLSRVLTDGLAAGQAPVTIAREMVKTIDGITKKRALVLARTEVIHAHAEGQLDSYGQLGVEEVGVMAEIITAGDNRVCPICAALRGTVYTLKEARGIIPVHANCRCSWIPSLKSRKPVKKKKLQLQEVE